MPSEFNNSSVVCTRVCVRGPMNDLLAPRKPNGPIHMSLDAVWIPCAAKGTPPVQCSEARRAHPFFRRGHPQAVCTAAACLPPVEFLFFVVSPKYFSFVDFSRRQSPNLDVCIRWRKLCCRRRGVGGEASLSGSQQVVDPPLGGAAAVAKSRGVLRKRLWYLSPVSSPGCRCLYWNKREHGSFSMTCPCLWPCVREARR